MIVIATVHLIPTALDLAHLVTWVSAVLLVAAVLGLIVVVLDWLGDFLEPEPDDVTPAIADEGTPLTGWPPMRSFQEAAAKGFQGSNLVDLDRRRRELEAAAGQVPSKVVH